MPSWPTISKPASRRNSINAKLPALALSPDGQRLAFVERVSKGSFSLRIMPASGGEPREILDQWKGRWLRWTPDGRHLLFARRKGRDQPIELWRIAVEGVEGGEPQKVLELDAKGLRFQHLSIHPDGQRIAFSSGRGGSEVWVMENFLPALKGSE